MMFHVVFATAATLLVWE